MTYCELKGVIDTSFEEGEKVGYDKGEKVGYDKGKVEQARQMAKVMKNEGVPIEKISNYTGLSREEIAKL